jgi:hypothetical protein
MRVCDGPQMTMILAQGPMTTSVLDFWAMLVAKKSPLVVMVTPEVEGGRRKCEKYWPDEDEGQLLLGRYEVVHVQTTDLGHSFHSMFRIQDASGLVVHLCDQIRFKQWNDHGTPEPPTFLKLVALARTVLGRVPGPWRPPVVHCSAGVGRSGVFAAVYYLCEQVAFAMANGHTLEAVAAKRRMGAGAGGGGRSGGGDAPTSRSSPQGGTTQGDAAQARLQSVSGEHAGMGPSLDKLDAAIASGLPLAQALELAVTSGLYDVVGPLLDRGADDGNGGSGGIGSSPSLLLPIKQLVCELREDRNQHVVQTVDQYVFIQSVMANYVVSLAPSLAPQATLVQLAEEKVGSGGGGDGGVDVAAAEELVFPLPGGTSPLKLSPPPAIIRQQQQQQQQQQKAKEGAAKLAQTQKLQAERQQQHGSDVGAADASSTTAPLQVPSQIDLLSVRQAGFDVVRSSTPSNAGGAGRQTPTGPDVSGRISPGPARDDDSDVAFSDDDDADLMLPDTSADDSNSAAAPTGVVLSGGGGDGGSGGSTGQRSMHLGAPTPTPPPPLSSPPPASPEDGESGGESVGLPLLQEDGHRLSNLMEDRTLDEQLSFEEAAADKVGDPQRRGWTNATSSRPSLSSFGSTVGTGMDGLDSDGDGDEDDEML